MNNLFDKSGKVIVVTDANSGLGAFAALTYAEAGAKIALLARRKEKLDKLASEIKAMGKEAISISCNIASKENVKQAMQEVVNHYGTIHVLLNNAGIAVHGGVHDMSEADWDTSFDVNVKGMFLTSKYALQTMIKNRYGKIINISSVNALIGCKNDMFIRHSYNASKAAVKRLTIGMTCSYGKYNITVDAIRSALFETEMIANTLFKSEEFMKAYSYQIPADRPGRKR